MSEVEKTVYTPSAKVDYIRNYINNDKQLRDIVYSFRARGGVLQFNPLPDEVLTQFFLEEPEDFPFQVKAAVLQFVVASEGSVKKDYLGKHIKIEISEFSEIKMSDWDAAYEGRPVSVNCQVIGAGVEETYTKKCIVFCPGCHRTQEIKKLTVIPHCANQDCERYRTIMEIVRASLITGPIKTVMIQEPLEEAKHGSPKIFPMILKDDDVKNTFIGQRKKVIGVFRSEPQPKKSTNKIEIHAINVHDLDDVQLLAPTDEEKHKFQELSKQEGYIARIVDSYAPEIKHGGSELAKICLILSIIGAKGQGRLRGFVHALLIGDPGTAKSKMLEFMPLVVQKSGFAVGGTASGAGITVAMDTLPNRVKMPRAGLIPNASGGCAAIDEMNQLGEEDQGKTYEAMESGKIHYNKAGFNIELIAETAIQGGANPKGYYYDRTKSIVENINMPGPLLSRFDLKINLLDTDSLMEETKILDHMSLIRDGGLQNYIETNNLLIPTELTMLFNYAKTFEPKFTDAATKLIKEFHLTMKGLQQPEGALRIDKRFPEAVSRVSVAYARLHFTNEVTPEHAMTVIEIYKKTMQTFGMNVDSGEMQVSMEDSFKSKDLAFLEVFRAIQKEVDATYVPEEPVLKMMVSKYSKFWKNYDAAGRFFQIKSKDNTTSYRAGRYTI